MGVKACCEWERSHGKSQSASICRLPFLLPKWSCSILPHFCNNTELPLLLMGRQRFFLIHTRLLEETLAGNIQIKYALGKTVWLCTSTSGHSYFRMSILKHSAFSFLGPVKTQGSKEKQQNMERNSRLYKRAVWKVVTSLCKWFLCPNRIKQGTFIWVTDFHSD